MLGSFSYYERMVDLTTLAAINDISNMKLKGTTTSKRPLSTLLEYSSTNLNDTTLCR